ncbi:stonustoxin subunit alpha-like [Boleophthalmus pectinirostris]|uniref:stonustoxin subunit alpha-like n=1 Tax=Boleophthalmus pectinirostris TaxID=150288 RepID=UPI00242D57F0|nr:stonustoxin subunit alpha-like [Boleophthalmus pectinirostris]
MSLSVLSLCGCGLSPHSCGPLASVLSSSSLTHLDLSHNDLQDSGVELLCSGLKSAPCSLETLRLSGCLVSERGGAALASALSSAPSHLRELDLSYNHPGPSAELLTALRDQRPLLSVRLDPAGECWMVPGPRKYSCEFSLDPNTIHRKLKLSEDKQRVTWEKEEQLYPDHEDKFTDLTQVLSSTGLRGRCYWEVEWRGEVDIAVGYRRIRRRGAGKESKFGENDQSWSLQVNYGRYSIKHNNKRKYISPQGLSSEQVVLSGRVGVFLDTEAGSLSFYEVLSDGKLIHRYTFTSSFTEPLFPGFRLWWNDSSVSVAESENTVT